MYKDYKHNIFTDAEPNHILYISLNIKNGEEVQFIYILNFVWWYVYIINLLYIFVYISVNSTLTN